MTEIALSWVMIFTSGILCGLVIGWYARQSTSLLGKLLGKVFS
jgi:hypothetical protein